MDHDWENPERPPVPDAVDHGSKVWSSPVEGYVHDLWVWHFCDHSLWLAQGRDPELVGLPRWVPGGVGLHTLVSREPLHLEPSVYWNDCCGQHGWIRDGRWVSA